MLNVCWNALRAFGRGVAGDAVRSLSGASGAERPDQGRHRACRSPAAARRPARCCSPRSKSGATTSTPRAGCSAARSSSIHYDDQSTPSNVPGIYTKLITVDKVDLLLGPYATNFVAPAMPTIMQHNKMTISLTAIGINRHFNYDKYFSMVPVGPDGVNAFSKGFFEIAAAQKPKPQTVAILAADAEFARSAARRRPRGAQEARLQGRSTTRAIRRPPPTSRRWCARCRRPTPTSSMSRAYPPDNVGIIRAANEIGLSPKMFGGAMIGMLITPIRVQLGPVANGLVISETFLPSPKLQFAGLDDLMKRYQAKAAGAEDRSDRLRVRADRLCRRPDAGAGGRRETKSLDHDKLADYMRKHNVQDRGRRHRVRQGRRMDASRGSSRRRSRTSRRTTSISSATARRRRSCGRRNTRAATSSIPTPTRGRSSSLNQR